MIILFQFYTRITIRCGSVPECVICWITQRVIALNGQVASQFNYPLNNEEHFHSFWSFTVLWHPDCPESLTHNIPVTTRPCPIYLHAGVRTAISCWVHCLVSAVDGTHAICQHVKVIHCCPSLSLFTLQTDNIGIAVKGHRRREVTGLYLFMTMDNDEESN